MYKDSINKDDVIAQAKWELELERFEEMVRQEKNRLRNQKKWFPWKIVIVNTNKEV